MGHFTRSLNHRQFETRAGTRSRSRGWKGQRTNNAPSRSIRRSGHSILASAALGLRVFDRNLICGEHYGQRPSKSAASTGRTHGCTDQHCITVKISLANREPSTHGYKRKSGPCCRHVRSSPPRPGTGLPSCSSSFSGATTAMAREVVRSRNNEVDRAQIIKRTIGPLSHDQSSYHELELELFRRRGE